MGGCTPAPRTARLPRSTRHSPHTPRAPTYTRPVPDTLGRPGCMSHAAGVAMRECKRPGMTSSPHSPRVYRLSRPGAVSARSVGAAALSPGGDIISCPPPTGVLRSNKNPSLLAADGADGSGAGDALLSVHSHCMRGPPGGVRKGALRGVCAGVRGHHCEAVRSEPNSGTCVKVSPT